ncbi:hypothetical protein Mapa_015912 [Marchantia paleacea]|nr:hypothetical protein Mapa_015912 [Marchantia paleacea]
MQKLHRDLPSTELYAYGTSGSTASYPGPTLEARRNVPTRIRWENHIADQQHMFPVDPTIAWANPPNGGVPTVTHLHGMEVESLYDGNPESWFTRFNDTGPKFVTQDYLYPNSLLPALLWYHDHTMGITRLNVIAGLVGAYIVRGPEEPPGLPTGQQEVVLVIQDKQFLSNGSINFPSVGIDPSLHPDWCPAYFGDTILVNGKVWPYLQVLPLQYRFRILNGASERYLTLSMSHRQLKFLKIGTDGGLLPRPVSLRTLTISPAERVDCVIDFRRVRPGARIIVSNSAPLPFPGGGGIQSSNGTVAVMQFRVLKAKRRWEQHLLDVSVVPERLANRPPLIPHNASIVYRHFTLTESVNPVGVSTDLMLQNRTWEDPVTEVSRIGGTEIWQFINLTPGLAHPIHLHLVKFVVLSFQSINITRFERRHCSLNESFGHRDSCFVEPPRLPDPQDSGWKDVVTAWPGNVTRILLRVTSQSGSMFPFDATSGPGYLWHCHLLSHEDNVMMRPLLIQR